MSCRDIQFLLNKRIDLPLSREEEALVAGHVRTCASCARAQKDTLAYAKLFTGAFKGTKAPALSPSFEEDFYRRLEKESRPPAFGALAEKLSVLFPFPARRALAGAFALLLVSFAGVRVYLSLSRDTPAGAPSVTNGTALIAVAVDRNKNAEQQYLAEAQARDLLKNIL